jgi:hypothetical protein
MNKRVSLLLAALASFAATSAQAETTTFTCDYKIYSDESGNHKAEAEFRLTFIVDSKANKAYMLGKLGSTEVELVPNGLGGLTFLEITEAGNVHVTAVDKQRNSVHSRSTLVFGDIVPSQYYGSCKVQ